MLLKIHILPRKWVLSKAVHFIFAYFYTLFIEIHWQMPLTCRARKKKKEKKKIFPRNHAGLEKWRLPSKIATFSAISYVFVYLKLKSFHPNYKIYQPPGDWVQLFSCCGHRYGYFIACGSGFFGICQWISVGKLSNCAKVNCKFIDNLSVGGVEFWNVDPVNLFWFLRCTTCAILSKLFLFFPKYYYFFQNIFIFFQNNFIFSKFFLILSKLFSFFPNYSYFFQII